MKNLLIILMLFLSALSNAQEIKEETRNLSPFNQVIAAHGINVKVIYNDLEEAYIKVKGVGLEDVLTEVEDMILKVRLKATIKKDITVMVEVSYKQLKRLEANTGAYIETERPLWGEYVKLYAITGGVIKAESEVDEVDAVTSGVSTIEIYGRAKKLDAVANLGGKISAFELRCEDVSANSKSGSTIEVYANSQANLKATLGGFLYYRGTPEELTTKATLGGEIKDANKKPHYGRDLIRDEH